MAIRILLVDDEPLALRGIERMIRALGPRFEIAAKAENGADALALIPQISPDIIITDMKMPVMNGVELVKRANAEYPQISLIVLSAYMDFEYSQEALRNNVVDYLLKPVEPEELQKVLSKLSGAIEKKLERRQRDSLYALVRRNSGPLPSLSFPDRMKFGVIAVRTGPLLIRPISGAKSGIFYGEDLFQAILEPGLSGWVLPGRDEYEILWVIGSESLRDAEIALAAGRTLDLQDKVEDFVTASYYPRAFPLELLPVAAAEAQNCLHQRLVAYQSKCFSTEEPAGGYPQELLSLDETLAKRLIFCAESGDSQGIQAELSKLMDKCAAADLPQHLVEQLVWQILHLFRRFYQNELLLDYDIRELISDSVAYSADLAEFSKSIGNFIRELLSTGAADIQRGNPESIFREIDGFLRRGLASNLSLGVVCERFRLSQSYLSRLFRTFTSKSFNEYLTGLRICRAQELIQRYPGLKLREIAEMSGYADHHYFSKVFKSETGLTPSEYREQLEGADASPL